MKQIVDKMQMETVTALASNLLEHAEHAGTGCHSMCSRLYV